MSNKPAGVRSLIINGDDNRGRRPVKNTIVTPSIRMEKDLWLRICHLADELGSTKVGVIRTCILQHLPKLERYVDGE